MYRKLKSDDGSKRCFSQSAEVDSQSRGCFLKIAVSNWALFQASHDKADMETYIDFLAGIAAGDKSCLGKNCKPDILIVREKQLPEADYVKLFVSLWQKCGEMVGRQTRIIPHTYLSAAKETGCGWLHLPLPVFQKRQKNGMLADMEIGTSVHSVAEAETAQKLGASYVTAGHIFTTDCKKDVSPRGIGFLEEVCAAVDIPVYAIGGIHAKNLSLIRESSASGACMMSEYIFSPMGKT